jgi:aromatic ring-opening dioxygenase LigB subunit
MGIIFACIAPHGTEIVPELAGKMLGSFAKTRRAMKELADTLSKQKPETIVLATPHNLRLDATIGVVTSEFTEGIFEEKRKQVKLRCTCDRMFAMEVLEEAKAKKLPVVGVNYGTSDGPSSCMPMDWGTLVPLWFFARGKSSKPKVVIVTPSREIPLSNLVRFGSIIAETARASGKPIAFVASADQGHAHSADGPYGFHPAAKEFDELIKNAVLGNNLKPLLDLPLKFIEDAKPDSLWQIAMLQGILERVPMRGKLVSYQVPTYFGMLCASFTP